MEDHERNAVAHNGQRWRRKPQLERVHYRSRTAYGIARRQIARARGIDAETTMRRRAAGVQTLRQRDRVAGSVRRQQIALAVGDRADARKIAHAARTADEVLKPNARVACEDVFLLAERVIAGLRKVQSIEVRLCAELGVREELLQLIELPAPCIQRRRVARVVKVGESRPPTVTGCENCDTRFGVISRLFSSTEMRRYWKS